MQLSEFRVGDLDVFGMVNAESLNVRRGVTKRCGNAGKLGTQPFKRLGLNMLATRQPQFDGPGDPGNFGSHLINGVGTALIDFTQFTADRLRHRQNLTADVLDGPGRASLGVLYSLGHRRETGFELRT